MSEGGDLTHELDAADIPPAPLPPKEREPHVDEEPAGAPEWVVTFTDMISLLVTFFVLLMTFSSMQEFDVLKVQGMIQGNRGLRENVHGQRIPPTPEIDQINDSNPLDGAAEPHPRDSVDPSENALAPSEDQLDVDLTKIGDGLILEWGREACFAPGSAELTPALVSELGRVAKVLANYPHLIAVEGHTDNAFAGNSRYADSTALSLARAMGVAELLVQRGIDPSRIQVSALSDQRPFAVADTADARRLNRRVTMRIQSLPLNRHVELERKRLGIDSGR